MEVNEENLRLFTAALRSGEYTQGYGTLAAKTDEGKWKHCCLGVACEVAIANGVVLDVREKKTVYVDQSVRHYRVYGGTSTVLPHEVWQWLGLTGEDGDPRLLTGHTASYKMYATNLNDNRRWSFGEIADAFEKTFLAEENNEDSSIPA